MLYRRHFVRVLGCTLLLVGAVVGLYLSHSRESAIGVVSETTAPRPHRAGEPKARVTAPHTVGGSVSARRLETRGASQSVAGDVDQQPDLSQSGGKARSEGNPTLTAAPAAAPVKVEPTVDKSVIGDVFPLSPSVEASCEKDPTGSYDPCAYIRGTLERMAKEPRDLDWADEIEEGLRRHVAALGST